jgi:hypothetical protein
MVNPLKKEKTTNRNTEKKNNIDKNAAERNTTSRKSSTLSSSAEEIDLILVSTDEEDNEDGAQCLHHKHLFSEHKGG